jgi:DNA-binding GntR family transcriptional regulator
MTKGEGGTRADAAFGRLRADILAGRLEPGQRLKFPDLSDTYGVSVSACREALTRLAGQGLVISEPHLGYSVTPLSREDLDELTDARIEMETLVFRRALSEGDLEWEQSVISTHHAMSRIPMFSSDDPHTLRDEWAAAHAAFHQALLAGCRNKKLLEVARVLRDSAELYRAWSTSLGDEPDRDLAGEHQRLCDLALARDIDGAVEALAQHISHTRDLLLRTSQDPDRLGAGARAGAKR